MTQAPHVVIETPVRSVARVDGSSICASCRGASARSLGNVAERVDAHDGAVDHRWRDRLARQGVGDRPCARSNARLNASSES